MDGGGSHPEQPSRLRPFLPEVPVPSTEPVAEPARPADVSAVRPYLLTGGRARPVDTTLEIEAQVVITETGQVSIGTTAYEQRAILELCAQPLAVAEVAARLGLHLGVARVLVADLVMLGYLAVRRPDPVPHRNVQILERVIRGLETYD